MGTVELPRSPSLPALYGRAVAGLVPRRGRGDSGAELPDTELVLRGVRVDRRRLADYARVCGFRLTDTLPPTYPHVLAFPLALALMTAPEFPFPAAGVVHLANRITQVRPLGVEERLDLAVHAANLRPHERGRQVDVVAEASVDGAQVWRDVSTYLHRQRSGAAAADRPREDPPREDPPPAPQPTAVWRVGADVGPAYAAVSGDRNPIHTSTLAAKAFGFRRRIAHGMWTKARCLAQLGPRLPDAYEVEVTFQAPILLPSTVHFSTAPVDGGATVALHSARSGRPHLSGLIMTLGS